MILQDRPGPTRNGLTQQGHSTRKDQTANHPIQGTWATRHRRITLHHQPRQSHSGTSHPRAPPAHRARGTGGRPLPKKAYTHRSQQAVCSQRETVLCHRMLLRGTFASRREKYLVPIALSVTARKRRGIICILYFTYCGLLAALQPTR